MKKALTRYAFVAPLVSAFFIAIPVHADSTYSFCDYTPILGSHDWSPQSFCHSSSAGNFIDHNRTLYGIEVVISSISYTGDLYYGQYSATDGTVRQCTHVTPVASLGDTTFIFDHPMIISATTSTPIIRPFQDASCSNGTSIGLNGDGSDPYTYSIWQWTPITTPWIPGLIFNSGTTSSVIFTSSSTVNIDSAFNSGGLATTTMQAFCDRNMPFDDSSIIKATLTAIPNSLCRLVAFVVIPSPDSLNQFSGLASSTKERFPFSYVTSIASTWENLSASSTANSPTWSFKLHDLGMGSTTSMGNILPNVDVFGASTTEKYFPQGSFDMLKALASIALITTLLADIFFSVKNMMK